MSATKIPERLLKVTRPITFNADGMGGVLSAGFRRYVTIPFACTLTNYYLVGDVSGSIQIDVKRSGTSIVGGGGNKPILSSAQRANAALSGWTSVAVAANDELEFYIDSCTSITSINLVLIATT